MSAWIFSWPGCEHMNLFSRAIFTLGRVPANFATAATSTVPAMLVPQSQT